MRRTTTQVFALAMCGFMAAFAATSAAQAPRDTSAAPKRYVPRPYGSDAQFNPLTVVSNEGFDMLRVIIEWRAVDKLPYANGAGGVWYSITHPEPVLRHYGWSRWVRNELLPLSIRGKGGAQWEPNYHLHLFGAGMTYARMADWYEARGVDHPRLASAATLFAGHFLNEVVENAGNPTREDEDGLTDLLIFDPAGMLLWNTNWMRRTFSGNVELNNWYGQATYVPSTHHVENAFSAFVLRTPLPRTDNWKLFSVSGNAFLVGLSRRVGDSLMVSAGGGAIVTDVPVVDARTNTKTVALAPNFGIFIDRNGSLLASFLDKAGRTNGPTLNIYPGVLRIGSFTTGFWVQSVQGGADVRGVRWGISSTVGAALGAVSR